MFPIFNTATMCAFAGLCVLLSACVQDKPADPMCRTNMTETAPTWSKASCLIIVDDLLLVLEHKHSGKYFLPGGNAAANEPSECVAHRHTWLQTGLNPLVTNQLDSLTSQHAVYRCALQNGFDASLNDIAPPKWVEAPIKSVQLHDPYALKPSQWHHYDELMQIRGLFNKANHLSNIEPMK